MRKIENSTILFVKTFLNNYKFIFTARFIQLVQNFKLKLSTSLVNEIMNAFEGPKNTVDQQLLKSFYLEEYPEIAASFEKRLLKLQKKKKKDKV